MARVPMLKPRVSTLPASRPASNTKRDPAKPWGDRSSRHQRGYDSEWTNKTRPFVLKRDNYLCQCPECKRTGRIREASEVDHIKPRAWFADGRAEGDPDDPSNLRAVHPECHRRLTLLQQGKKPRTKRPRIGLDGWPADER